MNISKYVIKLSLMTVLVTPHMLPVHSHASEIKLTSRQVHDVRSTSLTANANTPLRDIKDSAKQQLIRETLDILPTYISSTQSVINNEYSEKLNFIAAALIEVSKETYNIEYSDNMITLQLTANVAFDTNEINRKVASMEQKNKQADLLNDLLESKLDIEEQASSITQLYNDKSLSFPTNTNIAELATEILNMPVGDMVSEFELQQKLKDAEESIAITEATNKEWLSLTPEERERYKINIQVGNLMNSSYIEQIQRPLTLKVVGTSPNTVDVQVLPTEGNAYFTPWYIDKKTDLVQLIEKSSGSLNNTRFLNRGCAYRPTQDPIVELQSLVSEQSSTSDYKQNVFTPGYQVPVIVRPVSDKQTDINIVATIPLNVNWHLTEAEINNGVIDDKFHGNRQTNEVNVWGVTFTIDGVTYEKPMVIRKSSADTVYNKPWVTGKEYRYDKDINRHLEELSKNPEIRRFNYINPYRTERVTCGVDIQTVYPTFTLPRNTLTGMKNLRLTVFRY